MSLKNFVLIGAAGYIAPRHLEAIKATGNNLLAALDKHDSVGILDRYFPEAHFFTEFERFDRHCEKLRRDGTSIDYVSVCSPNYLHDAHIRFGFRIGADVICEKPLVLNPWNLDALEALEGETGRKVYTLLQLRQHPALKELKNKLNDSATHEVELNYVTPRGNWYRHSWKGDEDKSGGIVTNIGYHFFDLLIWLFGDVKDHGVEELTAQRASGSLVLDRAAVQWKLSVSSEDLPTPGMKAHRALTVDGTAISINDGFEDLHTEAYRSILNGEGIEIDELREVTSLIQKIRQKEIGEEIEG